MKNQDINVILTDDIIVDFVKNLYSSDSKWPVSFIVSRRSFELRTRRQIASSSSVRFSLTISGDCLLPTTPILSSRCATHCCTHRKILPSSSHAHTPMRIVLPPTYLPSNLPLDVLRSFVTKHNDTILHFSTLNLPLLLPPPSSRAKFTPLGRSRNVEHFFLFNLTVIVTFSFYMRSVYILVFI